MPLARLARSIAVAALLAGFAAHAEDAPVPAKLEPSHHNKFENDVVRILDVEVPSGGATQFHTHSVDYPYLMIFDATLKNELPGKSPVDLPIKAGLIGYYRASQGAYTHRFVNAGSTPFRAIGIELVGNRLSTADTPALSEASGFKSALDNERVRAYRIALAPGASAGPATVSGPSVLVSMGDGSLERVVGDHAVERIALTPAKFEWNAGPTTWLLRNAGDRPIELVWFEIK
jgi:hypothetical protein